MSKDKDEYLRRYKERGNEQSFIDLIDSKWDEWLHELTFCNVGCKRIHMVLGNLEREIGHIVRSENGEK